MEIVVGIIVFIIIILIVKAQSAKKVDRMGFWDTVDPAIKEAVIIIQDSGESPIAIKDYRVHMRMGERAEAENVLRTRILPSLSRATYNKVMNTGGGARWATMLDCFEADLCMKRSERPSDAHCLGLMPFDEPGKNADILFHGDGHLITVAPTGAGKGQNLILSNAMHYQGPMICFDPKGEIYETTAWQRACKGMVFKFAPYDTKKDANGIEVPDSDFFNPLDFIVDWDDADQMADLMVIRSSGDDAFWDNTAQELLADLIMFVKKTRPSELQNMREVCRLISTGSNEFEDFLDEMKTCGSERLLEQANRLEQMSDKLRSTLMSATNTHTSIWRNSKIANVTSSTSEDFSASLMASRAALEEVMVNKEIGQFGGWWAGDEFIRGKTDSVFLVVPADKISITKPVIRVMLGIFINELIKFSTNFEGQTKPTRPFLFLIDELAQLGRMKVIENALSIVRGYNIRLWMFIQDLPQLKSTYDGWEQFFGSTRTQIYFSPNDLSTAEYISRQLGKKSDILGEDRELATPQELMGREFKGEAIIKVAGVNPIRAKLYPRFFEDPEEQDFIAQHKVGDIAVPPRDKGEGN